MRNAKRKSLVSILVFSLLLPSICAIAPQTAFGITLLHEFAGGADDGEHPYGSLTLSGSTLYGMTYYGGDHNEGVVFRVNTDGTGYGHLHEFAGYPDDGENPYGSLILSDSTLYGMTCHGGDYGWGVVFKMNTDGSGYGLLHDFAGGVDDGENPLGPLTLSGSTLYGMTIQGGGDGGHGTVFKINTNGSDYGLLHEFGGGANDGKNPYGSLTLSGSTLFGMTNQGGDSNMGVVFKMNTDGSGYSHLHEFAGGANDGEGPTGSLTLSGSTLYGMTRDGGDYDDGTVFKMNTDGTGFDLLHEFAGGDGIWPTGSLTLSGSTLYGTTIRGEHTYNGVVFKMNTDGSGYSLMHEFFGGADDGDEPRGLLVLSGSTLYGMTEAGGDNNFGVIFALEIPEPSTLLLLAPALLGFAGVAFKRRK